jgi:TPR repeat protein
MSAPFMVASRPKSRRPASDRRRDTLFGACVLVVLSLVACTLPPRYADPQDRCTHEGICEPVRDLCNAGDADACLTLGYLYGTTTAGPYHQPELGEQYFLRACRLSVLACDGLLYVAETQRGQCEADYGGEARLVGAACDAGYPPACAALAQKLVEGVDVPRDSERAARLYAFACDVEDRFPDFMLRGENGTRVPPKDPMIRQLLACVRALELHDLGLAGAAAPPRTTVEEAMRRYATPPSRYQKESRAAPEKMLAELRRGAEWLAMSPADLKARVASSRQGDRGLLIGCRDIR